MNLLCIGNSFTVDATRYLHQLARTQGVRLKIATLFYPACTLEQHHRYMLRESADYTLYVNGFDTGFHMTLKDALLSQHWDIITIQQGSVHSANYENGVPYAREIAAFIRKCAPKAKLIVQQTWAYEDGSERLAKAGYESYRAMFGDIEKAYEQMAADIGAAGMIRSGKLLTMLMEQGIEKIHRDTLHVTKGLGRYALGLLWYRVLTGNTVAQIPYDDFDEPISPEEIALAKKLVDDFTPISA